MASQFTCEEALRTAFETFLIQQCANTLKEILLEQGNQAPPTIHVDCLRLLSAVPRLVNALFTRPSAIFPLMDDAAVSAQGKILRSNRFQQSLNEFGCAVDSTGAVGSVKRTARVRVDLHRLSCPGISPAVAQVRVRHIGRLLSLTGTLIRASAVKSHEAEHMMECTSCKHRFLVTAGLEDGRSVDFPSTCPSSHDSLDDGNRSAKRCKNPSIRIVSSGRPIVRDYQELSVQEPMWRVRTCVGAIWTLAGSGGAQEKSVGYETQIESTSTVAPPRALLVVLEADLVDSCKPGDDICISLIIQSRWHRATRDHRVELELVGHATAVQVINKQVSPLRRNHGKHSTAFSAFWRAHNGNTCTAKEEPCPCPLRGRDVIIRSICPQLCGLATAKLAVLLALIGGVPRIEPGSGTRVRGESHLLIIGDSGMGKSLLLRYAAQVAPRAVMTTGTGATAAGLTAAAVMADGGEGWSLEAGALVLADGGVCCIDEFDTISTGERAAIHEAMEQQTLSIAKGGLVAMLQTRCAVLGATNPKGMKFDPTASLAINTGLAPPLLSRFDCVLVVMDFKDPEQDNYMSSHMILSHCGKQSRNGIPIVESTAKTSHRMVSATTGATTGDTKKRRHKDIELGGGALQHLKTIGCLTNSDGNNSVSIGFHDQEESSVRGKSVLWPFDRVRHYIALVRYAFDPVLTPEAEALIRGYYLLRRRADDKSSGRPTIRLLESMIRMTQAHARLMWRAETSRADVVVAVGLVEASLGGIFGASEMPPLEKNTSLINDPDGDAKQRELRLIERITTELGPKW
eukprot:CAMPEP_0197578148 /NCGR_PEP_ID=MMETSP1326-20131121/2493_1 /TAXON_ID=1155430 /ORGANISM="Genus nov. species nov., Strain RCC2288" /LENGTH=798 /DNA_ID=CAMNT_0043141311 /DNA_START=258 /DNA_END=2651 /DNA_ORIENTATION=+